MTAFARYQRSSLCKKLGEWPEPDQTLWQAALLPRVIFEDGGARAGYSHFSNREVVRGYGRWLSWLERQGLLDLGQSSARRITPPRVRAYLTDLEKDNATQTLLNRLQQLRAAAQVMDPHQDWSWINTIASTIRARHRPARSKLQRLFHLRTLFDLGLHLIETADITNAVSRRAIVHRAIQYRDGLIIGLLAARQLRLGNLAGLVLDHTLVRHGTQWWIQIPAAGTKNRQPIEEPWPEQLTAALETYLACHRNVFLAPLRTSQSRESALWLSFLGTRMTRAGIYGVVVARTREGLGRAVNPHLFRDCAVTSLAIEDPDHIGIAARLLGHSTVSTTERYYNQARGVEASRLIQQYLVSLRNETIARREINQTSEPEVEE
jgi:integrase